MSHPRIEEVSDSDPDMASDPDEGDIDDFVDSDIMRRVAPSKSSPPPPPSQPAGRPVVAPADSHPPANTLAADADRSAYNSFQCLYPVYFDATRSRAEGRRVPSSLAVANPLAREIAQACSLLGLSTLLEPEKTHPKDWANPGRVKVGLKKMGGNAVSNKHHLYVLVAKHLRGNPTTADSPGLRVRIGGQVQPPEGQAYPRPAVPRGWKMGNILPYMSPAMTGGGVSENLFKDMMKEMQGGGNPMAALMAQQDSQGGSSDASTGKQKKDKKKGKGKA